LQIKTVTSIRKGGIIVRTIPFDPQNDLAPTPFEDELCQLALEIKQLGLQWHPHVGCFLWDPDRFITAPSPFPNRVYFVLSLPRFIDLLGSVEDIVAKLVWLPTWHQARLICRQLGIADDVLLGLLQGNATLSLNEDLKYMYGCICTALKEG
jgi:hypothetical protein